MQVLLDDGYVVLDVRSNFAREEGPMKNSYHAPLCVAKKRWDPETKSRVYDYEDVDIYEEWLPRVQKVIPDKVWVRIMYNNASAAGIARR